MSKNSRKVPYGWKLEGDKLVKDATAQKVIKEIVENHRRHWPLSMIAGHLNYRGIRTHRGGKWHGSTVAKIVAANSARLSPPVTPARDPNTETFEWAEYEWDGATDSFQQVRQRLSIADAKLEDPRAKKLRDAMEAIKNLTVAEKAETFRFYEPHSTGFGTSAGLFAEYGIDEIISEMGRATGRDMHKLIDGVTGQQAFKALLRKHANLLCQEIRIQRQANVSLRQELAKAKKDLDALRNPKSTDPASPCPYGKSDPKVLVMQSTKVRLRGNASNSLNLARKGRVLLQ